MASLEIQDILNSSNSKISIRLSFDANAGRAGSELSLEPVEIVGYNTSGFNISTANEYNNPLESAKLIAAESRLNILQAAAKAKGLNVGSPVSVKSQLTTVNNWIGSQRPQFNVNFYLVAFRRNDRILDDINRLNDLFFPLADNLTGTTTLRPPMGYSTSFENLLSDKPTVEVNGTMILKVGDWFQATNLNPVSLSYDISRETLENGQPLYANVNVSVTPYRMPTSREVAQYFL